MGKKTILINEFLMEKLRVLHLIPNLRKGGAERFALDVCQELNLHPEVEVNLVTLSQENSYSYMSESVPITCIHSHYIPSVLGKAKIEKQDYIRFVDEFKPHIIHTHLFRAELYSSLYLPSYAAFVTHGHDNMCQFKQLSLETLLSKKSITEYYERSLLLKDKYAKVRNYFIANSENTQTYFQQNLPKKMQKDVVLIRYGFNFKRFYNPELRRPPINNKIKIVNIGSFVDKKNQKLLVEIACLLKQKGLSFEINMLGDGVNRPVIQQVINENGLEDCVFLRGNVDKVEEYLWNSNLYVHTAWYEPFGLVFLEAMAAGLPCVGLDGKGNRSLIKDDLNGYFIKEQNADTFAKKIEDLAGDLVLYETLATNAVEFAKQYDISVKTQELVEFYKKIAKL
ncbi:glycosyltransferase family 4 protein [Rapidithrix thailandica]|uniref:Glycosyltransferase family 4 protein n=1 Tax=Rapidithrix thailandica TaxID=413964 RepID=A0AAW9SAT2_9BACT